jgi:hypothetical protein
MFFNNTNEQIDQHEGRQADRLTFGRTGRWKGWQKESVTGRQTNRKINEQNDEQTDITCTEEQIDIQAGKKTNI